MVRAVSFVLQATLFAMLSLLLHCNETLPDNGHSVRRAYLYLNTLREQAGMTPFQKNQNLGTSSENHAVYLDFHKALSHNETAGAAYATGESPWLRAAFAGYPSLYVGENLALDQNYRSAIDSLFSAIYHRFGFLSFEYDEVGTGYAGEIFVFNMGNSGLRALCEGPAYTGVGLVYSGVCDPDITIRAADYDMALFASQGAQPSHVIWPPAGSVSTSPAFFEETPDPLPTLGVSGYPASVQFNPALYTSITMNSFTLVETATGSPVAPQVIMNDANDPNAHFNALQFAFFPKERLKWNTGYTATFSYAEGADIVWSFTTKDLGMKIHTINSSPTTIRIPAGKREFAVYIVPTAARSTLGSISYSYSAGMGLFLRYEDGNTLVFSVDTRPGDFLTLHYHNDQSAFHLFFE